MAFEISMHSRGAYHLYIISGLNTKQNFLELADRMRDDAGQNNVSNFVLDCAGIEGSLSMGELYEVGNYFAKILKSCKLAGIHTPREWRNNSFSENVIHNRGGELEDFQSLEDAQRWFSK